MNDQQVIDKIRAILRKADEDNNAHEEERETAMRMANRLLLKYGLSMADIGDTTDDDMRSFEKEQALTTDGDTDSWRGTLLYRMGKVYFCTVYYYGERRGKQHWFVVGRKSNADTLRAMYEFVAPQIQRELDVALSRMGQVPRYVRAYAEVARAFEGTTAENDEELLAIARERIEQYPDSLAVADVIELLAHKGKKIGVMNAERTIKAINNGHIAPAAPRNLGVWRRSFLDGAIGRITSRLRDMMREEVEDLGEPGTALVKNEKADLDAFLKSIGLNLSSARSSRQVDPNAVSSGIEAGERADLSGHRKVGNVGPKQLNR